MRPMATGYRHRPTIASARVIVITTTMKTDTVSLITFPSISLPKSMLHFPVVLRVVLCSIILFGCREPEDTGPGQPVAHRRQAFLSIIRAFEPMGVNLRAEKYAPDKFIALAQQLDQVKNTPWQYFTPDSNYPPTHATAAVWSSPAGFETGRLAFLAATEGLVAAAATRDESKVRAAYGVLQDTCRDCHKVYKR